MSRRREQAFDKSMRLLSTTDFQQVFTVGKRHRGKEFTVIARANELDVPRLGLAISRRSAARAVDRNRLKRLVRERFRTSAVTLLPADIVVQATPTARHRSNELLIDALDEAWLRLALIKCRSIITDPEPADI
jgi:ribonuclease P protein component